MDKKTEAQAFMNQHNLKECWECDDQLFKHAENAKIRSTNTGKEIITHTANAGVKQETESNT